MVVADQFIRVFEMPLSPVKDSVAKMFYNQFRSEGFVVNRIGDVHEFDIMITLVEGYDNRFLLNANGVNSNREDCAKSVVVKIVNGRIEIVE